MADWREKILIIHGVFETGEGLEKERERPGWEGEDRDRS